MAAVGYTGGDVRKVDLAGDTMTGELVLADGSPAASRLRQAQYGQQTGLYVPADWGARWLAIDPSSALRVVAGVGSSTMQGVGSSNPGSALQYGTSFAERIKQALQQEYGDGGSGFRGVQWSAKFIGGQPTAIRDAWTAIPGAVWTETGSTSTPTYERGPCLGRLDVPNGATVQDLTRGRFIDVIFFNQFGATWTIKVDGNAPFTVTNGATITTTGGSNVTTVPSTGDLSPGRVVIDTGSSDTTVHTVLITGQATTYRHIGFRGYNLTGVVFDNYGVAGLETWPLSNRDSFESGTYVAAHRLYQAHLLILQCPFPNNFIRASRTISGVSGATFTHGSNVMTSSSLRGADARRYLTGLNNVIPDGTTFVSVDSTAGTAIMNATAVTPSGGPATITNQTITLKDIARTTTYNHFADLHRYGGGVFDSRFGGGDLPIAPSAILASQMLQATSGNDPAEEYLFAKSLMGDMARHLGAAWVDAGAPFNQSWAEWNRQGLAGNSSNPGAAGSDNVHASNAGHQVYANQILGVITRAGA